MPRPASLLIFSLGVVMLLAGCQSRAAATPTSIALPVAVRPTLTATVPLPTESPEPVATITPPTVTPTRARPHNTPVPENETPSPIPTATLPPPAQAIRMPEDVEAVVLLGTDYNAPYAGRTDTIQIAFLSANGNVSLVSVPRDLYVYQPGRGMDRINTAYIQGGVDLLFQTLEYNLGVRPQHWALTHLDDFASFVDDLGGIDVPISHPLPHDCGGIPPGVVHLSGEAALCYVRERNTSSDIDRSRRQQEVLQVIFQRVMSLEGIRRLPEWFARYSSTVQTDLSFGDLIARVPMAVRLYEGGAVHQFQIGWDEVSDWHTPENNAWVLLPKRERILPLLQQAVDVLAAPAPTQPGLETRVAELLSTPTETATPEPEESDTPAPEINASGWPTDTLATDPAALEGTQAATPAP